jgi:PTS system cellobiose-specific IIA component
MKGIVMGFEPEYAIMQLIMHAGDARSLAIEAIRAARKGSFDEASRLMTECQEKMVQAHKSQTELIFAESSGKSVPISLLMIHAQDHVMNAMTVKDMAIEMIAMAKENKETS